MILRRLIDSAVRMLGLACAGRRVTPRQTIQDGRVCVNLGCGLSVAPGWINVDASLNALFSGAPVWLLKLLYKATGANRYYSEESYCRLLSQNQFVFHDLGRSFPFADETIDVCYSSHFLEHLYKGETRRLLTNVRRALRPGGLVRIAVPDLEFAVNLYRDGKKEKMLDDYFFVEDLASNLARHKYMYDFEMMSGILSALGFADIKRCDFRKGDAPDIELLDNRPEETLFIEARRPTV